jgi:predicted nuclease of restriction endonuclease-like (RecB) superfamily
VVAETPYVGEDRAAYDEKLLVRLAADLRARELKGLSADMLERMRLFYKHYPQLGGYISAPPVRECLPKRLGFTASISAPVVRKSSFDGPKPLSPELVLRLSWTQLIDLLRIDDPWKRAFYENECLKGNWSKRQLQRQIGSLLYERTGLSKNKEAVIRRAQREEKQETMADLIRDPYVLEFTGLATLPEYAESALGRALLDHFQQFLLELGTGFLLEAPVRCFGPTRLRRERASNAHYVAKICPNSGKYGAGHPKAGQ